MLVLFACTGFSLVVEFVFCSCFKIYALIINLVTLIGLFLEFSDLIVLILFTFCDHSAYLFVDLEFTCSEGGFFNAIMSFPPNYPNSPPSVKFTSEIWHPNVYPDGRVCISILHPPGDDPNGYELASERWTPVHTVESIVLSIISMLSGPNDESPANVEAAKEWRDRRDDFKKKVSRCVRKSQEIL
ncbi:hypothetical protein RYX36_010912 [Vicia faba]